MHNIKVTYFNLPARGECIRLMLVYGEKDFEDVKYDTDRLEEWFQNKHKFPFGQLPIYEENGQVAHQTVAILRYLGKKFGLSGYDDWDDLEIDSIADTFTDFIIKIVDYHYEKSAKEKQRKKGPLLHEIIPSYLEKFEETAKINDGHLALKKLTWVDFYWSGFIDYLSWMIDMDISKKYPYLKAVQNNVFELRAITKWHEENHIITESTKRWLKKSGMPLYE